MNPDTTQTPRTDEACEAMGLKAFVVPVEISRQLERELSEKTNEVARLHNVIRDEWPPDQAEEIIINCKK